MVSEQLQQYSLKSRADEVLREITRIFDEVGIEFAQNDAKMLVCEAFGCSMSDVSSAVLLQKPLETLIREDLQLSEDPQSDSKRKNPLELLKSCVSRRLKREPLQYIVGHAAFRYLDLSVGEGVFIPRQETELIVQEALDRIAEKHIESAKIADLCAGSGAIGLSVVFENPTCFVVAAEKFVSAYKYAAENAEKIAKTAENPDDFLNRYSLRLCDATSENSLKEYDGQIDIVVSNPPYIPLSEIPEQPEVANFDPETALYGGSSDGLAIPEQIISRSAKLLKPEGLLVMEHDVSQGEPLRKFAQSCGFKQIRTCSDLTGRDRYLYAIKS